MQLVPPSSTPGQSLAEVETAGGGRVGRKVQSPGHGIKYLREATIFCQIPTQGLSFLSPRDPFAAGSPPFFLAQDRTENSNLPVCVEKVLFFIVFSKKK